MTALPEPTDEQIKAGRRASRKAWLEMADLTETNRRVADALASAPQEPDDDAEWLRGLAAYPLPFIQETRDHLHRIADRLQAKTPETGEE